MLYCSFIDFTTIYSLYLFLTIYLEEDYLKKKKT